MAKIFGALGPFHTTNMQGDFPGIHLGAFVACRELEKNIIQHGGFDCYHFLLGRGEQSDEDIARYIGSQGWDPQHILIYDGALPLHRLRETNYHVIHKLDVGLGDLLALRHALHHPLAPGIAMTHTISYVHLMAVWTGYLLDHVLPCDTVICTSRAAREALERSLEVVSDRLSSRLGVKVPSFRGAIEIIPLGVDVEGWQPEPDKELAKKRLGLPTQSCMVLCPARFSTCDKMDLRPLLMAVRRLQTIQGPDCLRVVLVGDDLRLAGGESRLIREFVEKLGISQVVRIDTDGTPSTIREYYRAADIFVSLVDNVQETFGLTVIQAMACGLPVIVSDWDGYKDTVVHGETGLRARTYWADCDHQASALAQLRSWTTDHLLLAQSVAVDTEEVFNYLYLLVTDPGLRRRLGEAGRKRAKELYAWPVVIKRYRELWDACHEKFAQMDLEEWARADYGNVFAAAYFRQFAHYPSAIISRETPLALLPTGAELGSASNPAREVPLPPDMAPVFHPAIFQELMSRLVNWPVAFGSLLEDVSRETGQPPDLIARHMMWLVKYGVVTPANATPNAQSVMA